jgi:hypothetical protein
MTPSGRAVPLPGSRSASLERPEPADEPMRLVHHHPGYLRIQADGFIQATDESPVVAAAQAAAAAAPGYRSWSHNPKTGSVVVEYDQDAIDADDLLKHIAKGAGFRGVEHATSITRNRKELVSAFLDTVQGVNQIVSELTGDRADLRELVPVAMAATSVVSFVLNEDRGRLPQWSSALYHSYRVFMQWHRPEVRTREREARREDESGGAGKKKSGDAR